jgi:hypothetical protein
VEAQVLTHAFKPPIVLVAALFSTTLLAQAAQPTAKPLPPSEMVSPKLLKTRIDTNCSVVKSAIKSEKPKDVVLKDSTWQVVTDQNIAVVERKHLSVTQAEVWKHAGNLVWVHWVTVDSKGNEHATQLCFRNDGSLSRARQATTVPALEGAVARQAYYYSNGTLIDKTSLYSVDDPAIYKRVRDLPFFKMVSVSE